jgi:hypothetical protein
MRPARQGAPAALGATSRLCFARTPTACPAAAACGRHARWPTALSAPPPRGAPAAGGNRRSPSSSPPPPPAPANPSSLPGLPPRPLKSPLGRRQTQPRPNPNPAVQALTPVPLPPAPSPQTSAWTRPSTTRCRPTTAAAAPWRTWWRACSGCAPLCTSPPATSTSTRPRAPRSRRGAAGRARARAGEGEGLHPSDAEAPALGSVWPWGCVGCSAAPAACRRRVRTAPGALPPPGVLRPAQPLHPYPTPPPRLRERPAGSIR